MVDFEKRASIKIRASVGGGPLTAGMIAGIALIVAGILLFVDNLGFLPFAIAHLFWPLVLVAWGTYALLQTRSAPLAVWASTAIVAGVLLGLGSYHIIRVSFATLWPLFLIAAGLVMLVHRFQWAHFTDRFRVQVGSGANTRSAENRLDEFALFSGVRRRIEAQNFMGGAINAIFGGVEIDLRRAGISSVDGQATIEANAAFGGIEIRVPETWRVLIHATAVFGAYEDKTLPPRPEPGVPNPTLIITGGAAFGGITLKN